MPERFPDENPIPEFRRPSKPPKNPVNFDDFPMEEVNLNNDAPDLIFGGLVDQSQAEDAGEVIDARAGLEEAMRLYRRLNGTVHFWQNNSQAFKATMEGLKALDEFVKAQPKGAPIHMTRGQLRAKLMPVVAGIGNYMNSHAHLEKPGSTQIERLKSMGRLAQALDCALGGRDPNSIEEKQKSLAFKLAQAEAVRKGGESCANGLANLYSLLDRVDRLSVSDTFRTIVRSREAREGGAAFYDKLLRMNGQTLLDRYRVTERQVAEKIAREGAAAQPNVRRDEPMLGR